MVKFKDLCDDSSLDLGKEVERLRIELKMAEQGYVLSDLPPEADSEEAPGLHPALLAGFQTADDFTIREQTLNYGNGDTYTGETLGTLRHGRGMHTCSNGDRYDGQWRYDKREGTGKMAFARGLKYEGEWKDNKAHGSGAAQYENGGVFVGEFREDHRWGWGTHYFPTGDKYEGEWEDDKVTGKGRMTHADGSYFEGEWLDGRRVKGKLVGGDGSFEYSGGWKGELRHGYGVMFQRGVCKYMGQWEADVQHGEGKCVYADGSQYDGQWKAGHRHGRGRFSHGSFCYEGDWRDDDYHGTGTCQTEAGDKYKGEFADGKRHGKGLCLYADGSKYEGEWQHSRRHGKGACLFANGDKYQGEWQADKRHGYGVCKFADGRKFRGEWEEDGWVQSVADPQHCRVAGPGVTRAVAGQLAQLAIEARDDAACLRLSGGDDFKAALIGPASVTADVKDNGDGTYSIAYCATVAGIYQLNITIGAEEHVAHSPYPLRVLPAPPSAKRCQVVGRGRCGAAAGLATQFTVELQDEYGNRCSGDPVQLAAQLPLEASLSNGACELPVTMEATRDGTYVCSYAAPTSGYWRLYIACRGQPLPRTPFSVHVMDPAAPMAVGMAAAAPSQQAVPAGDGEPPSSTCSNGDNPAADAASASADAGTAAGESQLVAVPPPLELPPLGPVAVRDEMRAWEQIAAEAFAADGSMEGWDSDAEREKKKTSPEDEYIKAHPNVPVVENLEDIWLVSRLQNERKVKEEKKKAKKLQSMRAKLEQVFGAPQPPSAAEVATAVKEILVEDIKKQQQEPQKQKNNVAGAKAKAVAVRSGGARRGVRKALAAAAAVLSQLD